MQHIKSWQATLKVNMHGNCITRPIVHIPIHKHIWAKLTSWLYHNNISFIRIEWTWSPITQRCFMPCLVEISASVLEKKNFKILSMYLLYIYFTIISFWKRMWPFILTKLNPLHSKMLSIKFCWKWLSGFINFIIVFSLIHYYLLLEKGMALHLNKLESPYPKDALY